jgi:hypothetical protein
MSYSLESSAATLANSSGYQRLASPYDAPGLIPITGAELVKEDFKFGLILNLPALKSAFRQSLIKLLYFST